MKKCIRLLLLLVLLSFNCFANRTDNFDRADTTNNIGTPSDAASDWVQNSGTWGISSNAGYASVVSGITIATLESGLSNVVVQITFSTLGGNQEHGVIGRLTDIDNCIIFYKLSKAVILTKRVAGDQFDLAVGTVTVVNGDVLTLTLNETAITGYVNGVAMVSSNDSFNQTATKHGIKAGNTAARFDNFSITTYTAPPIHNQPLTGVSP